jgi:linoleoyl-CoA desaturase
MIFPGMYLGQSFLYHFIWLKKGYIWRMNKPSNYRISLVEWFLKLFVLFSFVYGKSLIICLAYLSTVNVLYSTCILPDHDTFDTHSNQIEDTHDADWGEVQVRHSGNFATSNPLVCQLFGGINYQIEHHLFPTICHVHFKTIQPIVIQTCKEFNVPYVDYPTTWQAIQGVLKNIETINLKDKNQ